MIPKKLHFFWFGNNPKPPITEYCIVSWKKHLPGFEIIEWNETNFDVFQNSFCQEAFEQKKWAFVSDFARAKILFEHGGFYLDTDMEIKNNLEEFISYRAVCGFEIKGVPFSAFFAVEPGHPLTMDILTHYEQQKGLSLTPNTKIFSELLVKKYGADAQKDEVQELKEGVMLFPSHYFSLDLPKNFITHHFSGSWHNSWSQEDNTYKKLVNMYGVLQLLHLQSDAKKRIKDVIYNYKLFTAEELLDQFPTRYVAKYLWMKLLKKLFK